MARAAAAKSSSSMVSVVVTPGMLQFYRSEAKRTDFGGHLLDRPNFTGVDAAHNLLRRHKPLANRHGKAETENTQRC